MAVPKTAVNKDDRAMLGQDDIQLARQVRPLKPESAPHTEEGAHGLFRPRIAHFHLAIVQLRFSGLTLSIWKRYILRARISQEKSLEK